MFYCISFVMFYPFMTLCPSYFWLHLSFKTSLSIPWLKLHAFTASDVGSIPCRELRCFMLCGVNENFFKVKNQVLKNNKVADFAPKYLINKKNITTVQYSFTLFKVKFTYNIIHKS